MPFIYFFSVIWDFCTFNTWSLLEMHLNFLLTLKTCGYYILDGSNSWGIFRHFPSIKSWKGNKNEGEKKRGKKKSDNCYTEPLKDPWFLLFKPVMKTFQSAKIHTVTKHALSHGFKTHRLRLLQSTTFITVHRGVSHRGIQTVLFCTHSNLK